MSQLFANFLDRGYKWKVLQILQNSSILWLHVRNVYNSGKTS